MASHDAKFGPPPPPLSPAYMLAGQFVVAVAILVSVRPPFVCGAGGNVRLVTSCVIALCTSVACALS